MWVLLAVAAGLIAGCAARQVRDGVFYSPKGYRLQVPGPDWVQAPGSPADLELRHAAGGAAMMAHAVCGPPARRPAPVLERQLLLGLRQRRVLAHGRATVGGLPAGHVLLEALAPGTAGPLRIEAYVVVGPECVYDLVYAAPPERFDERRPDFGRFVASFAVE